MVIAAEEKFIKTNKFMRLINRYIKYKKENYHNLGFLKYACGKKFKDKDNYLRRRIWTNIYYRVKIDQNIIEKLMLKDIFAFNEIEHILANKRYNFSKEFLKKYYYVLKKKHKEINNIFYEYKEQIDYHIDWIFSQYF